MSLNTFSKLLSLAAVVAVANAEYWIFGGSRPIVTTRLDPIIFPNSIASHVHSVVGASRFKAVYDSDDLVQSNCTTIPVQPDKSNYWAPQLYHQDQQTGQLTPIPTSFNIYYLMRSGPLNQPIQAFPPGLRMLAGDTERRTYNVSSFADQAIDFVCQDFSGAHNNDPDWAERPSFFDHNCPDGMRAQVFFPSCWDGVNLDSPDHKSHLSYPIQNFNSGDCPNSHPVHLVSLFYEMLVSVDKFDYWGPGTWVLANGDTSGYGHHGDFTNGWDVDLLQDAIDNCPNANGNVMDCPPLAAAIDQASADACVLETDIVDEQTGFDAPLTILPGCNPLWNGTVPKPACPDPNAPIPSLVPAQTPVPSGWTEFGCIAEGTNGRALTGASTTATNMTRGVCAAFCASQGFTLAGVEFSDECYCDNEMRNGASMSVVTWNECSNHCAGNSNEICGGPQRLTLLSAINAGLSSSISIPSATLSSTQSTAPSSTSASAPTSTSTATPSAGWSSLGCRQDNVSGRTLNVDAFTSDAMTIDGCIAHCDALGQPLAGLEYARECYCGSAFVNGGGAVLADTACDMACSGDSASMCGGPDALTVFGKDGSDGSA
ncbi:hypothetical protein V8D89_002900 [Ganoderma adspersum]